MDMRRREAERNQLVEEHREQLRNLEEEQRRREEARRRVTADSEPAEKRIRVTDQRGGEEDELEEEEEEEEEEMDISPELEVTKKTVVPHNSTAISLSNTSTSSSGKASNEQPDGKSMNITMEVNGIIYSGVLYAKPS